MGREHRGAVEKGTANPRRSHEMSDERRGPPAGLEVG